MFSVFIRFAVSRRRIRRNREVQTRVLINVPSRCLQVYYSTIWRTCQYTLCSFRFYYNILFHFLCIITNWKKNHANASFLTAIFFHFLHNSDGASTIVIKLCPNRIFSVGIRSFSEIRSICRRRIMSKNYPHILIAISDTFYKLRVMDYT